MPSRLLHYCYQVTHVSIFRECQHKLLAQINRPSIRPNDMSLGMVLDGKW